MVTPILKFLCRASDAIVMVAGHIAAMLMPVLAGVVAFEVFSRYLLDAPTIWGYDTALFLFGYIAALGGAYAQQKRAHINVDILYLKVSGTSRRIFDLLTGVLAMFFLYVMIIMALGKYEEAIEFDYRTQSEWSAPMWHFWVMIMVAAGLFLMQLIRDFIANVYRLVTGQPLMAADEADDSDDDFSDNTSDSTESAQKTS